MEEMRDSKILGLLDREDGDKTSIGEVDVDKDKDALDWVIVAAMSSGKLAVRDGVIFGGCFVVGEFFVWW